MKSIYKNIYYDKQDEIIHLWTDDGYFTYPFEKYGYVKAKAETNIKSISGIPVIKVPLSSLNGYRGEVFESDVKPEHRFLVDTYYDNHTLPKTNLTMVLDIETAIDRKKGFSKPPHCLNPITAITFKIKETGYKKTLLLDKNYKYKNKYKYDFVSTYVTEEQLLRAFLIELNRVKPSIITGWNSRYFDIPYIYFRLQNAVGSNLESNLSPLRNAYAKENKEKTETKIVIPGVSELDYMLLYKKFTPKQRSSYALEYIAQLELGEGKIKYKGNLQDLYENDIDEYVRYNVEDVELIIRLDEKLKMIDKTVSFAHMACVPYEDALSAVMHTEGLFLTMTKRRNQVVPNKKEETKYQEVDEHGDIKKDKIVGAYVKESKKGRFKWNYDADLTSLYPLSAVTLNISPETKFAKIRDYITVWMEKDKTHFRINHEIFNPALKEPDYDRKINVYVDLFDNSRQSFYMETVGDLYAFLIKHNLTISGNGIMYKKDKMGIIPEIILEIFELRKKYKNLRDEALDKGDTVLESYYDQLQWNYKIVINSIYGVLCNQYFRFYDQDNGQSITLNGRYTNMTGMDTVKRIYKYMRSKIEGEIDPQMEELFEDPILTGDTDSIIMTAMPLLYQKFGKNYEEQSFDVLIDTTATISKQISEKINKRMDIFASKWLNADKSYLWFKEEWVADVGYYSGVKKRYANRIQFKEGKRKEELDVKGLDIVRSSFPKDCQVFMKTLLMKILNYETKESIDAYVVNFYDALSNISDEENTNELLQDKEFDIYSISPISSVNKLDKYVDENNHVRKGASPAIKGSNNFNRYLEIESLMGQYQKINEGDKVCWVYMHKNPYGFATMSLPLQNSYPDSLKDMLYEYVDYSKCITSLLNKKVNSYYDALAWSDPYTTINDINNIFE